MFFKQQPKSILIICMRRIGDALLITPLIHTLKKNWPTASIDVLVFEGAEQILCHNPDINHIISIPEKQLLFEKIKFLLKLWNRYDLAISTQTGDRPTLSTFIAGHKSIGPYSSHSKWEKWKKFLLSETVDFDSTQTHTVTQNLKLAEKLGFDADYKVKLGWRPQDEVSLIKKCSFNLNKPFVVLHPVPRFKYKMWHQLGWTQVMEWLINNNFQVVLTAGKSPLEQEYTAQLCQNFSSQVTNMSGKLTLSEVSFLLTQASAYVGVDTVTTHMAAASGIPTIALFGPTSPLIWGPWPINCTERQPFKVKGTQHYNNVTLLQSEQPACVPCHQEGCDRHLNSDSLCLTLFPADKVIAALTLPLKIPN